MDSTWCWKHLFEFGYAEINPAHNYCRSVIWTFISCSITFQMCSIRLWSDDWRGHWSTRKNYTFSCSWTLFKLKQSALSSYQLSTGLFIVIKAFTWSAAILRWCWSAGLLLILNIYRSPVWESLCFLKRHSVVFYTGLMPCLKVLCILRCLFSDHHSCKELLEFTVIANILPANSNQHGYSLLISKPFSLA